MRLTQQHRQRPHRRLPTKRLPRLSDSYFDTYYFPTNPTTATADGLHDFDTRLEDYSRAGVDANVKALQHWQTKVAAVDATKLGERVRGDYELVMNNIRSTLLTLQTLRPWQKNPDIYSSGITNSAFTLMERKFAPPETRLRDPDCARKADAGCAHQRAQESR